MKTKWQTIKLSELANIKIGPFGSALKIGELKQQGPVRVLYIENIVGNSFDPSKEKFITEDKYKELKQYTVESDDIVVTIMGTIGRTALVPKNIGKTIISSHLIKITTDKEKLLPAYLNYIFQNSFVSNQVMSQSKGAIMKGLNSSILKNLQIPLPSIKEQEHIVEQLNAIKSAQALNDKLISKSEELFGAVLRKDTSNHWHTTQLAEIADIKIGGTPRRNIPEYWGGDNLWVSISELKSNVIVKTKESITDEGVQKSNVKLIPKGTTLMSFKLSIGKVGIAGKNLYTNEAIAALIPDPRKVIDKWLFYVCPTIDFDNYIAGSVKGKTLNKKSLSILEIPTPDLITQQKNVEKLDKIQNYQASLRKQKYLYIELLDSTLHKYLAGELHSTLATANETRVNINFGIQQAIGALLNKGFKRGEMAIAKVLYLTQEVYSVPIGIQFSQHNFGPYDAAVRKSLTSGLSRNNQFFRKSGTSDRPYYELGDKGDKILKYHTAVKTGQALNELLPKINNADSASIERLATVCKVIQDNNTFDNKVVQQKVAVWKPGKFTEAQIDKSLEFIKANSWDERLLSDS